VREFSRRKIEKRTRKNIEKERIPAMAMVHMLTQPYDKEKATIREYPGQAR